MSTSTATRNASWRLVRERLPEKQREVLGVLQTRGPLSDREIAEELGCFPSDVTAPRGALVKERLVEAAGRGRETRTGRSVTRWRAVGELPADHFAGAGRKVQAAARPSGYACAGCGDEEPPFLVVEGRALCGPCNAGEALARQAGRDRRHGLEAGADVARTEAGQGVLF